MSTLALNKPRAYEEGEFNDLPAIVTDIIYEGSAVGLSSGYARPLVAGDAFQGFAVKKCDNSAGAAGDKNVRVRKVGEIEIDVTGVTGVTDVGSTVYASDDDTFTLASTSNSSIGKIVRYVSGTTVVVHFEAAGKRSI